MGRKPRLFLEGKFDKVLTSFYPTDFANGEVLKKYKTVFAGYIRGQGSWMAEIKTSSTGIIDFTGGSRSGKQISREVKQRTYKYSQQDCDLIIGVDTSNGDCYIIPIEELSKWKNSTNIKNLQQYKENWQILVDLVSTNKIIE